MSKEEVQSYRLNSIEDHTPQLLYRTMNGKIVKRYTESVPDWAKQIID